MTAGNTSAFTGCGIAVLDNFLRYFEPGIFKTRNGESGNGNGNGNGNGERGTGNGESLKRGIFKSGNL